MQLHTLWLTGGFACLVAAAVYFRDRPETHKRLMLLAAIAPIGAAVARMIGRVVLPLLAPGVSLAPGAGPLPEPVLLLYLLSGLAVSLVLPYLLALVVYDLVTLRKLHPATLWGGLFVLLVRQIHGDVPLPVIFHALFG